MLHSSTHHLCWCGSRRIRSDIDCQRNRFKLPKFASTYHIYSTYVTDAGRIMNKTQVSEEKKLTLLLLFWFFGLLSIHRFYTGKYLTGGLQILILMLTGVLVHLRMEILPVICGGLLFLWFVIDFMHIIMGKFTDKEGKPIVDWV